MAASGIKTARADPGHDGAMTVAADTFAEFVDGLAGALDDHEATGEDWAARHHFSRFHFDRMIKSVGGEPPQALRRRILLERAAYRMITTKAPLLDIAVEAGYSSHEAFTRAFTKAYDVAPREWREKPGHIQIGEPSGVHFVPPGEHPAAVPRPVRGPDSLEKMVEHHVWLTGELVRVAERPDRRGARRAGPVEDDDDGADDPLAAEPAGRPDGHVERRDGDPRLRLERRGPRVPDLDARRLGDRGAALPGPRARGLRPGPARRHLRRRPVRPGRGVHLRRDDRARAHVRGVPPDRVVLALARHGHDELGWGDPMRWVAERAVSAGRPPAADKMAAVEIAFLLVALAVTVLAGTTLAERLGFPAPLVLIVVGVAASFVPGVPTVHLTADVVLLGLLPPLLYSAAIQTSLVDFNANRRPILLLSVGLVVFTTLGVGVLVHVLLPELDVVGCVRDRCRRRAARRRRGDLDRPPDRAAATDRHDPRGRVALQRRDRAGGAADAIAAGAGGVALWQRRHRLPGRVGRRRAIGFAVFFVVAQLRRHVTDPVLDTAISFVVPFATYIVSEELHSSGVVSVVVAGLLLGHKAPIIQTAQSRIAERMNWRTIAFFLENTVFMLIGLQARWIIGDVSDSGLSGGPGRRGLRGHPGRGDRAAAGLGLLRPLPADPARARPRQRPGPPAAYTFLLGWAGMRGVVTLAAAFVIPADTPYREVLLLIAFTVVAGTLFIQGLSLPWLARRLRVPSPDPLEDALARATVLQQASKAGFKRLKRAGVRGPPRRLRA